MDPFLVIVLLGALGGSMTFVAWKIETLKAEEPTKPTTYWKLVRNLVLGAMSAVGTIAATSPDAFPVAITPLIMVTSFMSGLGGEFLLQKGGKAISK